MQRWGKSQHATSCWSLWHYFSCWGPPALHGKLSLVSLCHNLYCMVIIAGQCRTIPWPALPDWPLMPECRCQTVAVNYRKKCRCRINSFSGIPTFRHLQIIFTASYSKSNTSSSRLCTCRVYPGGNKEVSSIQLTNSALVYEPKCGGRGRVAWSQPMSTALYRSPNQLWRSNSILNLWVYHFPLPVVWTCSGYPFQHPKWPACHCYLSTVISQPTEYTEGQAFFPVVRVGSPPLTPTLARECCSNPFLGPRGEGSHLSGSVSVGLLDSLLVTTIISLELSTLTVMILPVTVFRAPHCN